jgi:hypothetical protein
MGGRTSCSAGLAGGTRRRHLPGGPRYHPPWSRPAWPARFAAAGSTELCSLRAQPFLRRLRGDLVRRACPRARTVPGSLTAAAGGSCPHQCLCRVPRYRIRGFAPNGLSGWPDARGALSGPRSLDRALRTGPAGRRQRAGRAWRDLAHRGGRFAGSAVLLQIRAYLGRTWWECRVRADRYRCVT